MLEQRGPTRLSPAELAANEYARQKCRLIDVGTPSKTLLTAAESPIDEAQSKPKARLPYKDN